MLDVSETVISECGTFRYTLRRELLEGRMRVVFIMLNPSTADAKKDDPTTRAALEFAARLRCREYLAVNLFAFRSKNPKDLRKVDDPIGPENDRYLLAAINWAERICVAWGAGGTYMNRDQVVIAMLRDSGKPVYCFGKTKDGHPNFPLYQKRQRSIEIF